MKGALIAIHGVRIYATVWARARQAQSSHSGRTCKGYPRQPSPFNLDVEFGSPLRQACLITARAL